MATKVVQAGGSFAPPLTDELISKYQSLIGALPQGNPIKDILMILLNCCVQWWKLPVSTGEGSQHPSGRGIIIPLDDKHAKALDQHIPWDFEVGVYAKQLDTIHPVEQTELRNAAFHLLWHVKELDIGREPITTDKL